MKNQLFASAMLLLCIGTIVAQTPTTTIPTNQTAPARSQIRAIASTQYTEHTELFAEFRPLLLNIPARFTAHLTQIAETFKPYTEAEVTLTLTIDGKIAWQQTLTKPTAPGIYRFPVKAEITGTGTVTIALKMPTYSEQFTVENVTVYADEATALSKQSKVAEEEPVGEITYYKEKSWLETFATANVFKDKNAIKVPKTAVLTENGASYVFVQSDPEHFRKQVVKIGKSTNGFIIVTNGLKINDRIVTVGGDKIK